MRPFGLNELKSKEALYREFGRPRVRFVTTRPRGSRPVGSLNSSDNELKKEFSPNDKGDPVFEECTMRRFVVGRAMGDVEWKAILMGELKGVASKKKGVFGVSSDFAHNRRDLPQKVGFRRFVSQDDSLWFRVYPKAVHGIRLILQSVPFDGVDIPLVRSVRGEVDAARNLERFKYRNLEISGFFQRLNDLLSISLLSSSGEFMCKILALLSD
ncbi:hypothetical protein Tco_1150009 [Tanacetum coccineum]